MAYLSANERKRETEREAWEVFVCVSAPRDTYTTERTAVKYVCSFQSAKLTRAALHFHTRSHARSDLQHSWPVSSAWKHTLFLSFFFFHPSPPHPLNLMHTHVQYLGSVSVPAQVLREAVEADVVGLTLRPCRAEGQAVTVLLHLLHLQRNTHTHTQRIDITVWS